jgi:hypothetical protein
MELREELSLLRGYVWFSYRTAIMLKVFMKADNLE